MNDTGKVKQVISDEDLQYLVLTYQYVWGKDGHVDGQGTLVSVVSLDKESGSFVAEESWLQSE